MARLLINLRPLSARRLHNVLDKLQPNQGWEVVITPNLDVMKYVIEDIEGIERERTNKVITLWLLLGHSDKA